VLRNGFPYLLFFLVAEEPSREAVSFAAGAAPHA
jgi:hypothetical protein